MDFTHSGFPDDAKWFMRPINGSLAAKSGQSGHVEVGVVIGESGDVEGSDVSTDTLHDADVTTCITRVVRRMRFPSAEARTDATLPEIPSRVSLGARAVCGCAGLPAKQGRFQDSRIAARILKRPRSDTR